MRRYLIATALLFLLAFEPVGGAAAKPPVGRPIEVQIFAFNDFHGNIEPPKLTVPAPDSHGGEIAVPAGGVAYLAGALERLRGRPSLHDDGLRRRPDRRVAARIRLVPRRADGARDERAAPRP